MQQLSMAHLDPASAPAAPPPEGIVLRTFRNGDEQAWADIINTTDMGGDYGIAKVRQTLTHRPRFDPAGLFFACDAATGEPLATACAWWSFSRGRMRPTLHMVGAKPAATGKGLGRVVCRAVLDYFARGGRREVVLTTDDHRLPALATYLRLGFQPARYHRGADHAERWEAVFKALSGKIAPAPFAGRGRPVAIGVFGLWRGAHLAGQLGGHPAGQVAAGCDRNDARRGDFIRQFSAAETFAEYGDLLASPAEAVIVANDCPDHAGAAIAALDAGKDVLSEVTAFHTPAEGVALVEAAQRARGTYMMAENCLYASGMMELTHQAAQGALGALQYAEGDYVHDCRYLMSPEGTGHWRNWFPPLLYCTHPLGPILRAGSDRPVRVVGMHAGSRMERTGGGIDLGSMLVGCASGALVRIAAALAVNREPASLWVCYYGLRGAFETDRWTDRVHLFRPGSRHADGPVSYRPTGRDGRAHTTAGHFGADPRLMEYWVEALANGLSSPIDVYEAADMTLPGILGHRSSVTGSAPIDVPDLRDGHARDAWRDDHARPDPANPTGLIS